MYSENQYVQWIKTILILSSTLVYMPIIFHNSKSVDEQGERDAHLLLPSSYISSREPPPPKSPRVLQSTVGNKCGFIFSSDQCKERNMTFLQQ